MKSRVEGLGWFLICFWYVTQTKLWGWLSDALVSPERESTNEVAKNQSNRTVPKQTQVSIPRNIPLEDQEMIDKNMLDLWVQNREN